MGIQIRRMMAQDHHVGVLGSVGKGETACSQGEYVALVGTAMEVNLPDPSGHVTASQGGSWARLHQKSCFVMAPIIEGHGKLARDPFFCFICSMNVFTATALLILSQTWSPSLEGGGGISLITPGAVDKNVLTSGLNLHGTFLLKTPWKAAGWALEPMALLHTEFFPGSAGTAGFEAGLRGERNSWNAGLAVGYAYAPTKAQDSFWPTIVISGGYGMTFADIPLMIQGSIRYVAIIHSPSVPLIYSLSVSYVYDFGVTSRNHSKNSDIQSNTNNTSREPAQAPTPSNPDDPDGDGVPASKDACPHSLQGAQVGKNGCEPLQDGMELSNVVFSQDGRITPDGKAGIIRLAELLRVNPQVAVRVRCVHHDAAVAAVMCDSVVSTLEEQKIDRKRLRTEPATGNAREIRVYFVLP